MKKALITFVSALVLAAPVSRAWAQVDCETARCIFDQTINTQCNCDAGNHGKYVSCVAHTVNALKQCGILAPNCKGKVTRCAARSTCGKPGFSTCTPTCVTDPVSGAMTCSNDPTVTCTTNTDCGMCHTKQAGTCPAGTTEGSGSCCPTCAALDCTATPGAPGCACAADSDCTSSNCCAALGVCG
nr:hypothetical protein Hi04_10k_c1000_00016 [uncultured bacterium]